MACVTKWTRSAPSWGLSPWAPSKGPPRMSASHCLCLLEETSALGHKASSLEEEAWEGHSERTSEPVGLRTPPSFRTGPPPMETPRSPDSGPKTPSDLLAPSSTWAGSTGGLPSCQGSGGQAEEDRSTRALSHTYTHTHTLTDVEYTEVERPSGTKDNHPRSRTPAQKAEAGSQSTGTCRCVTRRVRSSGVFMR